VDNESWGNSRISSERGGKKSKIVKKKGKKTGERDYIGGGRVKDSRGTGGGFAWAGGICLGVRGIGGSNG